MFRPIFIVAALCLFGLVIEAKPKIKETTTSKSTTTTTTTAAPTTDKTTVAPKTEKRPKIEEPVYPIKDVDSIILFGYDVFAVGSNGSSMIHQFVNTILPYTGYGHVGVVSLGECPASINVPVVFLMGKDLTIPENHVIPDSKVPNLVEVVRKIREILYNRVLRRVNLAQKENQVAVLFVDPSVTSVTPELTKEIERFQEFGVKVYLVNVGPSPWPQSDQLYHKYMFNIPSYQQLVLEAQNNPKYFKPLYNVPLPSLFDILSERGYCCF